MQTRARADLRFAVRCWWLVTLLVGCGRINFQARGDDAPGIDAPIFDARPDAPPNATTLMFGAAADTYISQDMESGDDRPNNFGSDDKMKVKLGEDHGLLRFDISSIPTTASVFSADLSIAITGAGVGLTVGVFPVREAWIEGTQQGTAGACNWTLRNNVAAWSNVGAAPPGSADPQVASFPANANGRAVVALPSSLVDGWVKNPGSNQGVLLMATTDDSADFGTRESPVQERPQLVVTFVP